MRTYFITMTVLGLITLLAAVPPVATLLILLSFGLALPFLILGVNFFIYGLCLFPMILFGRRASAVSIALIVALALLPSWLERRSFAAFVEGVTAEDIAADPTLLNSPKTVLVMSIEDEGNFAGFFEMGDRNECSGFCEALLRGGAVETVQLGRLESGNEEIFGTYTLGGDEIVSVSQQLNDVDLIFWLGARSSQLDADEANEIAIEPAVPIKRVGRVTVTTGDRGLGSDVQPIVRRTDVEAQLLYRVSVFAPALDDVFNGGTDMDLVLLNGLMRSDGVHLWGVANDLGIPLAPYESPEERRARIRAAERAEEAAERAEENARRREAFDYAQASVYQIYANIPHPDPSGPRPGDIRSWLRGVLRYSRPLSDFDRDIIRQILDSRDTRFANDLPRFFWQDDELAKEFFPRLIAELDREAPQNDALIEPMLEILHFGQKYDEEFERYSDQIRPLMEAQLERDPAGQYLGLISAGYRFGIDERPFMVAFPTGTSRDSLLKWVEAICELPPDQLSTYGSEVARRVRPVLMRETGEELPETYVPMLRYLVSQGLEHEVRTLLTETDIIVDLTVERNVFGRSWDSEDLCPRTNRRRFR